MKATPLAKASRGQKRRPEANDTMVEGTIRACPVGQNEAAAEKHRLIEEQRRRMEQKLFEEMLDLIKNGYGIQSPHLTRLTLLETAHGIIDEINLRHQDELVSPSYLTDNENKSLRFEASNAFMFVTTTDAAAFQILYVTDSIDRVLHFKPNQWCYQSLLSFIHPDDSSRVQSQLALSTQQLYQKSSIECRLQQDNGSYSSVIIDGMVKKLDQTLKPVSVNEPGFSAFIGICSIPLISDYSEKNTSLYQDSNSLVLSCRCSPKDWKIFLVDSSVTRLPSVPLETFRNQSILAFIDPADQASVCQALITATTTVRHEVLPCHFIHPSTGTLSMIVDIKPIFNTSRQRTDFLELTFSHIDPLMRSIMKAAGPLPSVDELLL